MTSEPDSKPGRRPPIIELKAAEIENPAAGDQDAAAGATAAGAASGRGPAWTASKDAAAKPLPFRSRTAVGAALAVAVIAAIGSGSWLAGFDPFHHGAPSAATTPDATPPAATVSGTTAPSAAEIEAISARLDKLDHSIAAQQPDAALGGRLTAAEAQTKALGDSLAALDRRVDGVAATSRSASKQADAAIAAADAAKNTALGSDQKSVQQAALDALSERIAALESAVKALADSAARQASRADDAAARLTIAAEALRAAVERGVPYQAELAAVQSLGADRDATLPLEPFATSGLPGPTALARELAALVPALDQASGTAPGDKTFIARLQANAQKLVHITPVDAPTGTDPASVIARIAVDAARSDIAAGLVDVAALPDEANPLAAAWVREAQARDAAIAASRRIASDALASLGKSAAP